MNPFYKDPVLYAFHSIVAGTNCRSDNTRNVILLKAAASYGAEVYDAVVKMILNARAGWLVWHTNNQRYWQSRISKRPQRCKVGQVHGDTIQWVIDPGKHKTRAHYVECHA